MQRFYIQDTIFSEKIELNDKLIINQLIKVLRVKKGAEIIFFDGKDQKDFVYFIDKIENKKIIFKLKKIIEKNSETNFGVILYQALPNKYDKIEYIIQKGTEIGIKKFVFFKSNRSQNNLSIKENKINRFCKIIEEASEQSGRNTIPQLVFEDKINIDYIKNNTNIILHTQNTNSKKLKEITQKEENINIFIGPEGGFDNDEINYFVQNNFINIFLGNRVLRTETAGISTAFFLIQNLA